MRLGGRGRRGSPRRPEAQSPMTAYPHDVRQRAAPGKGSTRRLHRLTDCGTPRQDPALIGGSLRRGRCKHRPARRREPHSGSQLRPSALMSSTPRKLLAFTVDASCSVKDDVRPASASCRRASSRHDTRINIHASGPSDRGCHKRTPSKSRCPPFWTGLVKAGKKHGPLLYKFL